MERTRNQAVQLNPSDLLGAIAREARRGRPPGETRRRRRRPPWRWSGAPIVLRNNTPPTTHEPRQEFADVRDASTVLF